MIRDVLIAGINRGQLVQVALTIIFIIAAWRMPPEDLAKIASTVLNHLVDWSLVGWFLGAAAIMGWGWHARSQRRTWTEEMRRVSAERTKYQELVLKDEKIRSSER